MCAYIKTYQGHKEINEAQEQEDLKRWERFQLTGHTISQKAAAAWLGELAAGAKPPCPK